LLGDCREADRVGQLNLTRSAVKAIEPTAKDQFYWDAELRGFGLKVTPKGAKSYVLQYRMGGREASTRRYTIGRHGSPWTPDLARDRAKELLRLVDAGQDPVALDQQRRTEAIELAFDSYADRFVDLYLRSEWRKTWREAERIINKNLKPTFGKRPINQISRREITGFLDGMADRPAMAQQIGTILRKMLRWAVNRGDLTASPMADMKLPGAVPSRDRVLTDEELALVWRCAGELSSPFRTLVRLLIATGQRREEVASLDWSEIDLDKGLWSLPAQRSKNGRAHLVPLNDLALVELRLAPTAKKLKGLVLTTTGNTPISGFSRSKKRLDDLMLARLREAAVLSGEGPETAQLTPWRIHDLRRTVATGLQRLAVRLEVTEAVLNHVSGSRSGVGGIYQRHDWADEKRQALALWAEHVRKVVSGSSADGASNA
jgi:integrase